MALTKEIQQFTLQQPTSSLRLCSKTNLPLRPLPQLSRQLLIPARCIPSIRLPHRFKKRHPPTSSTQFLPHIHPRRRPHRVEATLSCRHEPRRVGHVHEHLVPKVQLLDEPRLDHARMHAHAQNLPGEPPADLARRQDVGQLGLAVARPGPQGKMRLRCPQRGELDAAGRVGAIARRRREAHEAHVGTRQSRSGS